MASKNIDRITAIEQHYQNAWGYPICKKIPCEVGLSWQLPLSFSILEIPPFGERRMWTYATLGMSAQGDAEPLELHLFSRTQYHPHVELLSAVAHYHLTGDYLGLGHTVNIGRPWMPNSICYHGLISLPYLDGPVLEWGDVLGTETRFLWLIPISKAEKQYRNEVGMESLELLFESQGFDYTDPSRPSVV